MFEIEGDASATCNLRDHMIVVRATDETQQSATICLVIPYHLFPLQDDAWLAFCMSYDTLIMPYSRPGSGETIPGHP